MSEEFTYDFLKSVCENAMNVCDPVQYKLRQQNLLHSIAGYILQGDKPNADKVTNED